MSTPKDHLATVRRVLSEQLGRDESEINPETDLADDLGADSLDFVEITFALEEEYDIAIDEGDAEKWNTVADIVAYFERQS